MAIKQTLQAIRALGLRCTWSSEWQEYRVFYPCDAGDSSKGYYTTDSADALATAQHMAANKQG